MPRTMRAAVFAGPGRIELRVRRIGYTPLRRAVELVPGLDQTVSLALDPLPDRLDSVTVTTESVVSIGPPRDA